VERFLKLNEGKLARTQRKIIDIKSEPQKKPEVILDDIFFHKTQVDFGTRLHYYGRMNPMSTWEVVGIESYFLGNEVGDVKLKKVNQIRYLSDMIKIKNIETGETRKLPFIYMSYSAIWRLA